jgi:hypothetical protein
MSGRSAAAAGAGISTLDVCGRNMVRKHETGVNNGTRYWLVGGRSEATLTLRRTSKNFIRHVRGTAASSFDYA